MASTVPFDLHEQVIPEPARGKRAEGAFVALPVGVFMSAPARPQETFRHRPGLEAVERSRQIVELHPVLVGEVETKALLPEGLRRVLEEVLQFGELDHAIAVGARPERAREQRRAVSATVLAGTGAREGAGVEAPGTRPIQETRQEAAVVEALQGVNSLDLTPVLPPAFVRERGDDRVAQLREHGRVRYLLVGTDAVTRPGDDKVVTGSQHSFEDRLTGLRAGVTVADEGGRGREVVAVGRARHGARVDLVEPEEADHAEGQPPKRRQGSDGDTAPEEVGTARSPLHPLREEAPEVRERDLDRRGLATDHCLVGYLGDDPAELIQLPLLADLDFEELLDGVRQGIAPLRGGARPPHVVGERRQTCDEIGQSAGDGDVVTLDCRGERSHLGPGPSRRRSRPPP